jgi:hypothetical protein
MRGGGQHQRGEVATRVETRRRRTTKLKLYCSDSIMAAKPESTRGSGMAPDTQGAVSGLRTCCLLSLPQLPVLLTGALSPSRPRHLEGGHPKRCETVAHVAGLRGDDQCPSAAAVASTSWQRSASDPLSPPESSSTAWLLSRGGNLWRDTPCEVLSLARSHALRSLAVLRCSATPRAVVFMTSAGPSVSAMVSGKRRVWAEMAEDVLLLVLQRLTLPDLCRCCLVSRHWRRVCSHKTLWAEIDVSHVAAEQVTHTRLLQLVARAQGARSLSAESTPPSFRSCRIQP